MMRLVAQKLFGQLWDNKDNYIVTIDGEYNQTICADNDHNAVEQLGWGQESLVNAND